MPINWRMDEQSVVYRYSGKSFILKKEQYSDICYNTSECSGHWLSETSQLQKDNTARFHLHEIPRVVRTETESRTVVSRGWREGELVFNRYRVLVLQDERGVGMNDGDNCTTM